jgi:hypothetical protein
VVDVGVAADGDGGCHHHDRDCGDAQAP